MHHPVTVRYDEGIAVSMLTDSRFTSVEEARGDEVQSRGETRRRDGQTDDGRLSSTNGRRRRRSANDAVTRQI